MDNQPPDGFPFQNPSDLKQWYKNIDQANLHNIFCHCLNCDYEWVDSRKDARCQSCGSEEVEYICCWQFPDG